MKEMEHNEELPLPTNAGGLRLIKVFLPYVVIVAQAYAIIHISLKNEELSAHTIEILKKDIEFKKESMKSWREADEDTRNILLEIIRRERGVQ